MQRSTTRIGSVTGNYDKKPASVLSIRQFGEAWDRPFVVIYEPSTQANPTVQSVENIMDAEKIIGVQVVSKVGSSLITDRIIAQDNAKSTCTDADEKIRFTGRFAIVRTIDRPTRRELNLYIGDGEQLTVQGHELNAGDDHSGYTSVKGK